MSTELHVHVLATPEEAAAAAAAELARTLVAAARRNGRATLALSRVDEGFAAALAEADLPWTSTDVFQVDERVAREDTDERNATVIAPLAATARSWNPMPVDAPEPLDAARRYETLLRQRVADGFDAVHLGLGADGHTASLTTGDAALTAADRLVAATGPLHGHRRITLTLEALNAARRVVWLVTGEERAVALRGLVAADRSYPAGRVLQDRAVVFADETAAAIILKG